MSLENLKEQSRPFGLFVMGALHESDTTLVLLGADAGAWPLFKASAESADAAPDPLDRWSKRILGGLAAIHDAQAIFPSDGPPYAPFIRWAMDTGRFFQSPTGMMVHPTAGLMISIRGALRIPRVWPLDTLPPENPCHNCEDRPCVTACPIGALSADHAYDVPTCKAFLDTVDGADCMSQGCNVRRACPISQSFRRDPEQSAFHMRSFKG